MLWAAATTCFFGFFRAGEITVASATAYDPVVHLSWGTVSVDMQHRNPLGDPSPPKTLKVRPAG